MMSNNHKKKLTKQEALEELAKLDESVLLRLVEFSQDKKAIGYMKSSLGFSIIQGALKQAPNLPF